MEDVRRVVIRDKYPVLEPEVLDRPLNRLALAAAGASVFVQITAVVKVAGGQDRSLEWLDLMAFAGVAFVWFLMGLLVFLQRRARRARRIDEGV